MAIGAIIGTIIVGLGSALSSIGNFTANALAKVFDFVRSVVSWFINVAPKPLRIFVFLFMLLFISNVLTGLILSTSFTCTSTDVVRKTTFFNGVKFAIEKMFHDVSDADILAGTTEYSSTNKMVRVVCSNETPRPYLYNINILSFPLWILILILVYFIPLVLKWYRIAGATH